MFFFCNQFFVMSAGVCIKEEKTSYSGPLEGLMGYFVCLFIGALIGYLYRYAKEPDKIEADSVPTNPSSRGIDFNPGEVIYETFQENWRIIYSDAKGESGERNVTPKKLYEQDDMDLYILAFCHNRQADRWFKVDRIDGLIVLETGEAVEDPYDYISDFGYKSPKKKTEVTEIGKWQGRKRA